MVSFKGKPAKECYIKIFGRKNEGEKGEFMCDGQTDLNGKFRGRWIEKGLL